MNKNDIVNIEDSVSLDLLISEESWDDYCFYPNMKQSVIRQCLQRKRAFLHDSKTGTLKELFIHHHEFSDQVNIVRKIVCDQSDHMSMIVLRGVVSSRLVFDIIWSGEYHILISLVDGDAKNKWMSEIFTMIKKSIKDYHGYSLKAIWDKGQWSGHL